MTKREIVKTVYDTVDGQTFECRHEAEMHEQSLLEKFDIKQLVKCVSKFCARHQCENCPFYNDTGCGLEFLSVADWEDNIF